MKLFFSTMCADISSRAVLVYATFHLLGLSPLVKVIVGLFGVALVKQLVISIGRYIEQKQHLSQQR